MALADDLAKAIAKVLEGKDLGGEVKVAREQYKTDEEFEEAKEQARTTRLTELNTELGKLEQLRQTKLDIQDIDLESIRIEKQKLELIKKTLNPEEYARQLKNLQAQEAGLNAGADAARRFLGVTSQQSTIFSQLAAGGSNYLDGFQKGLANTITPMNMVNSGIDKVVQGTLTLAAAQDQAVVSFRKATGAGGMFDSAITDLERSLFTSGVTANEASQVYQTLFSRVSDFTMMSEAQQKVLAETTAVLQELGVSAENAAKNIQFSIKVLGMSAGEAEELQRDLLTFAKELGVGVDQISGDFASLAPQIAAMGSNGVVAFKNLEAQAKSTGLQLSEIVSIVEQFNKFDTAAQSVGKLNALLGGPYLNTLELVAETDLSKRFEILKDRIDSAGLSFNTMGFYQKKALASALGLNEAQLAMLMQGNIDQIMPTPKSAEELIELQKQTAQFNTVLEELQQIAMGLVVSLAPFISFLKTTLQFLSPMIQNLDVIGISLIAYSASTGIAALATTGFNAALVKNLLFAGAAILLPLLASVGPVMKGIAIAIGVVTAAVVAFNTVQKAAAAASAATTAAQAAQATAQVATAATAGPAATGLGTLASVGSFAIPIMYALGASILGIGLGIGAIGAGIGIAAAGMSLFVNSLTGFATGLAESMTQTALAIQDIVESINNLSLSKTVAIGAVMVPLAAAAPTAALAATTLSTQEKASSAASGGGATAPAAAAGIGVGGPPPVININLQIDSKEFKAVVNEVSVEKYSGGKPSEMYASIIDMIQQGVVRGA